MDAPLFSFSTNPLKAVPLTVTCTAEPDSAVEGADMVTADELEAGDPCDGVSQLPAPLE